MRKFVLLLALAASLVSAVSFAQEKGDDEKSDKKSELVLPR
jgi:hypothetical protein